MEDRPPPFFFIHVMKSAGTTFRTHLRANMSAHAVYPDADLDLDLEATARDTQNPNGLSASFQAMLHTYTSIDQLLAVTPARRAEIRAYCGHFPFMVTEMLGQPVITLTALRHPVSRTLSYLRMNKRLDPFLDASLDEIYEHGLNFEMFIHDHQTKVFSMTPDDHPNSIMDAVAIDDERLARAKTNLEQVDVVGLAERFDDFLAEMTERFGWHFDDIPDGNVRTGDWPASEALCRRIEADSPHDLELYEYAVELVARRAQRVRFR